MAEIISCTDCGKKLRVPDELLGKKVKCPGCGILFMAQAAPDEDQEEEESSASAGARTKARAKGGSATSHAVTTTRKPKSESSRPDDEEEDDYPPRARKRSRLRDEEDEEEAPRKRRLRDEDEDEDRPSRGQERKGWGLARMGMNLTALAGWVRLATFAVGFIGFGIMMVMGGGFLTSFMSGGTAGEMMGKAGGGFLAMGLTMVLFWGIVGLLSLAELILRLTGYGLAIATPKMRNSVARPLGIAAFACATGAAVVWCFGFACGTVGLGIFGELISYFSWALYAAGWILYLVYLYSAASAVKDSEAARSVVSVGIAWAVFFVGVALCVGLTVVLGFAGAAAAFSSGSGSGAAASMGVTVILAIILWCVVFLAYLGLYVWYLLVVQRVRDAVDRRLRRL